jgi:hypothetical protein
MRGVAVLEDEYALPGAGLHQRLLIPRLENGALAFEDGIADDETTSHGSLQHQSDSTVRASGCRRMGRNFSLLVTRDPER